VFAEVTDHAFTPQEITST
jgi:hypothetical protein